MGINELTETLNDLYNDLKKTFEVSYSKMILIVSVVTTVITTISFLVQYIIAKFLLIIFSPNIKSNMFYALIPKTLIIIINIIFMKIGDIYIYWFYLLTSVIGSIMVLLFFQYKKENWKASILFAAPFITDALFSFGKEVF